MYQISYLYCDYCHKKSNIETIPVLQKWICSDCVKKYNKKEGYISWYRMYFLDDGSLYGQYTD